MSEAPLSGPRLRAAISWWRAAAEAGLPPEEADFVSQDPRAYAQLLSDAFIVDARQGELTFRFVGTELSDYIGWAIPGQKVDLRQDRRDSDLVREALVQTAATLTPHVARGRVRSADAAGPGSPEPLGFTFEVLCVPLATASGGLSFFGVVSLAGHRKLPPATLGRKLVVDSVEALFFGGEASQAAGGDAKQARL